MNKFKKYKAKNKEKIKEKIKEYNRRYYLEHKEERKENSRQWRLKNPNNEARAKRQRAYDVKRSYGLTLQQDEAIRSKGCWVCGTKEGKLCIDHCHETGEVRSCLCSRHNIALEHLRESPAETIQLYNYIVNVCQPIKEKKKCIQLHSL